MTTQLKVLRFCHVKISSECKVIASDEPGMYVGKQIWCDLTVNADFGDMSESELVGKIVDVERLQPFEYIGVGVSIAEEQQ